MTLKRAIKALDFLIENKQVVRTGMLDPKQSWNGGNDIVSKVVFMMADGLQNDIEWLRAIRKQLLPEQHRTKIVCKHPKKDRAITSDGQKYCMNCNADL